MILLIYVIFNELCLWIISWFMVCIWLPWCHMSLSLVPLPISCMDVSKNSWQRIVSIYLIFIDCAFQHRSHVSKENEPFMFCRRVKCGIASLKYYHTTICWPRILLVCLDLGRNASLSSGCVQDYFSICQVT